MHPDANATIQYGGDGFFIAISPSGHSLAIDTSSERNSGPRPMEMLLMALGACTGVDVVSILKKKRERVTDYRIEVRGERRKEIPRAYQRIEVRHILRGHNLSEKAVAQAVELSDTKYCSVAATLRAAAEIITTFEIVAEESPVTTA
jgi:putative redox protein